MNCWHYNLKLLIFPFTQRPISILNPIILTYVTALINDINMFLIQRLLVEVQETCCGRWNTTTHMNIYHHTKDILSFVNNTKGRHMHWYIQNVNDFWHCVYQLLVKSTVKSFIYKYFIISSIVTWQSLRIIESTIIIVFSHCWTHFLAISLWVVRLLAVHICSNSRHRSRYCMVWGSEPQSQSRYVLLIYPQAERHIGATTPCSEAIKAFPLGPFGVCYKREVLISITCHGCSWRESWKSFFPRSDEVMVL